MSESSQTLQPFGVVLLIGVASVPAVVAWLAILGLAHARGAPMIPAALVAAMGLLLPAGGLSGALDDRRASFAAGLFFWGLVVLISMPMFFPGERARALSGGFSLIQGEDPPARLHRWAEDLDEVLPGAEPASQGVPVVEAMDTGEPPPLPISTDAQTAGQSIDLESNEVVLPYRPDDNSIVIPVDLEGPDRTVIETYMTYDTGATLTTLDPATLRRLGIAIPETNPVIELRTAAGVRRARLVLLERIWMGGFEIQGVTISVCEECRSETSTGLLGLNATGRFRIVVDQQAQVLVIEPRKDEVDQLADIEAWVKLTGTVERRRDGAMVVELALENQSRMDIARAVVHLSCGKTWPVEVGKIPAHGSTSTRVQLEGLPECDAYELELGKAWW